MSRINWSISQDGNCALVNIPSKSFYDIYIVEWKKVPKKLLRSEYQLVWKNNDPCELLANDWQVRRAMRDPIYLLRFGGSVESYTVHEDKLHKTGSIPSRFIADIWSHFLNRYTSVALQDFNIIYNSRYFFILDLNKNKIFHIDLLSELISGFRVQVTGNNSIEWISSKKLYEFNLSDGLKLFASKLDYNDAGDNFIFFRHHNAYYARLENVYEKYTLVNIKEPDKPLIEKDLIGNDSVNKVSNKLWSFSYSYTIWRRLCWQLDCIEL